MQNAQPPLDFSRWQISLIPVMFILEREKVNTQERLRFVSPARIVF